MVRQLVLILCIVSSIFGSYFEQEDVVVICVPVANCLGKPAQDIDPSTDPKVFYEELACSPEKGPYSCGRIHQCLFNEAGVVQDVKGEELLLEFPHFYYYNRAGVKASSFWVHQSSIVRASSIDRIHEVVPEPLSYDHYPEGAVLTLTYPWYDERAQCWYSVGTRFISHAEKDTENEYAFWVMDRETHTGNLCSVSKRLARLQQEIPVAEKKQLFVKLLRSWLPDEGVVPYIWGGVSLLAPCGNERTCVEEVRDGQQLFAWRREGNPQHGFDCSGLVLRAAQCAGIHYFCKNTTTIEKELEQVMDVQEGDLILVKGHVMVVSSLKDALLIDAYGYSAGYGALREVSLETAFEGIVGYDELLEYAQAEKPLIFKNAEGESLAPRGGLKVVRLKDLLMK